MKLFKIIETIENIAPPHLAASWDNCGLQVASNKKDIEHLALCLDPCPKSIEQAIKNGADFIISHHPLLIEARLPAKLDHFHKVLSLLFKHDTALYSAHTSLDINPYGPAGWFAKELQLQNTKVLEIVGEIENFGQAGYGLVGELESPISYAELIEKLNKYLDLSTATLCGELPKTIKRIAYCTGSGSSFMQKAKMLNADIFITGDVKYHSALETTICTLDVGHHSLEEEMMNQFSIELKKLLPNIRVKFVASASPLRSAKV